MNKKGTILIMGIFATFALFILAIFIAQTVDKSEFDRTAGEDAMSIEKLEIASYRQRFFLENEGEKILDELEAGFPLYLESKLEKSGSYLVINSSVNLRDLAYEWMNRQFNSKLNESLIQYNKVVSENERLGSGYLIDSNISYSLYAKGNYVYAYALNPIGINQTDYTTYYYWPHIRVEHDLFKNLLLPYDTKSIYDGCAAIRDSDICEEDLQNKYPDHDISIEIVAKSSLPGDAIQDSLIIDPSGDLLVKVRDNGEIHYESSENSGQTWSLDIDNQVLIDDLTLYDKYLADGIFKKYILPSNGEEVNFYFDDYVFISS